MSNPVVPQTRSTRKVPLYVPCLDGNEWRYVKDALDSTLVSGAGPYVEQFENAMAKRLNIAHTLAVSSGTAALHVALIVAGVGPGDEVIAPSLTFIASINAIRYVGATPLFWDSSSEHWNGDPQILEKRITPNTKAIIAVDLYGHAAQMDAICSIAHRHGLVVIEDASEALGASYQEKPCGTWGDIGCFSFNGNKLITTGGGGMLVSSRPDYVARARYLINQAKDDPLTFTHDNIGYNYRLSNIAAALGCAQLEQLDTFIQKKSRIEAVYNEAFKTVAGLRVIAPPAQSRSSHWLYSIALADAGCTSETFCKRLIDDGVEARTFFRPGHTQKPYQSKVTAPLQHAEKWFATGFNLPCSVQLSDEEQQFVIAQVMREIKACQR